MATIHTTPVRVGDYEEVKGSLKLMDAHTLQRKCRANSALASSTLTNSITRTRCLRVRCRRGADFSPGAFDRGCGGEPCILPRHRRYPLG